ncbi:MAG: VTT domain-containing protein [Proteobacteria bacterium]|nr:VTT domain-containing protein [Pseudomonadota bacterium]MDA0927650.1 VTT domain-containing protein [Pseudomonadota bacterium]
MRALLLKHFNTLWIVLVLVCAGVLFANPDWVTRESISNFLNGLGALALVVYIVLSLSRALLMIPCTPFVLAGGISFPDMPFVVVVISFAGIAAGAYLVYSFPAFGSYDEFLEERYPDKIAWLKQKLHGPYAFWIIAGWSFFPLVPTDAICYVAGLVKITYKKLVTAVIIGEIPLVTIYVYLGVEIGEWLRI